MFRSTRSLHIPTRDLPLSPDTTVVLHQVYNVLLGLLSRAKLYVDAAVHGTTKLVPYFSFMTYCLISKTEKLMFSTYFMDLWNLFQPKLSEPAIATNHNKQALLSFWYNVCVDCPENVRLIVQNPVVTKNIAFNYILADHDDQDVVLFNRGMLPAYYGILRMCCEQSPAFTRQLASHQNIQWAFKNLTPHASQYPAVSKKPIFYNLPEYYCSPFSCIFIMSKKHSKSSNAKSEDDKKCLIRDDAFQMATPTDPEPHSKQLILLGMPGLVATLGLMLYYVAAV